MIRGKRQLWKIITKSTSEFDMFGTKINYNKMLERNQFGFGKSLKFLFDS